jgi:hypothetical protein
MKPHLTKAFALLTLITTFFACKKFEKVDFKEAWNPDLAIPLAYTTFGVYDVLARVDSSDILINDPETGAISLVYNSTIASLMASDFFGDININENYSYSTSQLNLPIIAFYNGTQTTTRTEILDFSMPNNEELDHVSFKSGFFNFTLNTDIKQDIMLNITFPKLLNGLNPVTREVILDYNGNSPMTADFQIDLTNLIGDFTLNGTSHNKLEAFVQTTIIGDNSEGISGPERFNIALTSQNVRFKSMDGYFGQTPLLQLGDSVLIRIYQNAQDVGHFELKNPMVNFTIKNSFGLPINLHLDNLKTINTISNQSLPLAGFPSPIQIPSPTTIGQVTTTKIELNNTNTTNLSSIITPTPKYFYYEVGAQPNPNGKTSIPNFVDETSQIEINAEVNLPLEGYMYGFFMQDTVPFSYNQDVDYIESVLFRLIADNAFPVNVFPQISAMDENFNLLFNLFSLNDKIIDGAPVDENGKVINSLRKITDINLTADKIDKLPNVKHLIIRAETNSSGYNQTNPSLSSNVKFFDFYNLKLQLSMNVKYQSN